MISPFQSWLAPSFDRFVAIKQATGMRCDSELALLLRFDRYLIQHAHGAPLKRDTLIAYFASLEKLSPRSRENVVSAVWRALSFARIHDAPIDPLPPRPLPPPVHHRVREPRLVGEDSIRAIIVAARRLSPLRRAATYATLYGLLFTTGMRIGEALALDLADLNLSDGLITIRRAKFGKSRVLPIKDSTVAALDRFLIHRRSSKKQISDAVFVSVRGRRLTHAPANRTFHELSETTGLLDPLPCLHDLRHSFAVLQLVDSYRQNRDVNAILPVLSTYLGHVTVDSTRTYLRANGLLLREACRRFALSTSRLDEVLS